MIASGKVIIAIPVLALGLYFLRSYMQGGMCNVDVRLDGKVVIITGANTGLGKENAIDHVQRGARVIMACRSEKRAMAAVEEIKNITGVTDSKVKFMKLDLASLKSVSDFASEFKKNEKRLDILINNAGVMWVPYSLTEDGFEQTFGVNHLAHFLLTHLLLDMLKQSAPSRIVNLSSLGHTFATGMDFDDIMGVKSYSRFFAYSQSKLANILFTRELADRLKGTGVTVYAVHPGGVKTELSRYLEVLSIPGVKPLFGVLAWPFIKEPRSGAQTQICCAVDPALASSSGKYYSDCAEKEPSPAAQDDAAAKKLWEISVDYVGLKPEEMII